MTLRVIHTSDWHLGATLFNHTREAEHAHFLDFLLDEVESKRCDVLLISGDVFHQSTPPAAALNMWYGFLARASRISSLAAVIVVGGNHDSAARLDAPQAILSALRVHVIGGYDGDLDKMVVPVSVDGELRAVVLAVPFVHEYRLGIHGAGVASGELAAAIEGAFGALYNALADRAEALHPGVPILATGHLTCGEWKPGDFETELHQIGTIGAVTDRVFDSRSRYVALGHIHRSYRVARRSPTTPEVWYSGSPIALRLSEVSHRKSVLLVDVDEGDDGSVAVERLPVPPHRRLVHLDGDRATVVADAKALTWDEDLPPYVFADVHTTEPLPGLHEEVSAVLEREGESARLVQLRQLRVQADRAEGDNDAPPSLHVITPEEVLQRRYNEEYDGPLPNDVLAAFRQVLGRVR